MKWIVNSFHFNWKICYHALDFILELPLFKLQVATLALQLDLPLRREHTVITTITKIHV
jgi:hypothetical protein